MRKTKVLLSIIIAITGLFLAPAAPVMAIDIPDSVTINTIHVYNSVIETGDSVFVFHGKTNYDSDNGTYPDVPASSTMIFRFVADNGTVMSSTVPYVYSPFETNGYGNFVSSFYFDADSAPTWGAAHKIEIIGLATHFTPVQEYNKTVQLSDYATSNSTTINRELMAIDILNLCDKFQIFYPDVSLKSITDVGTVLSIYGEAYFKSVIPGLLNMCPQLFAVQVTIPEVMPVTAYDMSLGDTYSARMVGSDLIRGATRLGAFIGVNAYFVWGLVMLGACIALMIFTTKRNWGIEPGIGLSLLLVIGMSIIFGNWIFALTMIISLIAIIALMYIWLLRKA